MIYFKKVSKIYDNGTVALKDVDLEIEKGEFVFVVGASGAGKSTFLKLITREEVPSSGIIKVGNYVLNDLKRKEIPYYRRNLGVVFQDFRLIPNMSVYDNVAFAMRAVGAPERDVKRRVSYVVSLVDLEEKYSCKPNELSGGEQQRVALARALANKPDIIIADEPTGNIDPEMSNEIVRLLMKLNENGTTVVMVTHEHRLVRNYEKRVIILDEGCVYKDGVYRRKASCDEIRRTNNSVRTELKDESPKEKPSQTELSFGEADSCRPPLPRRPQEQGSEQGSGEKKDGDLQ
ncbi:MAG: cell division ATP-binding protein FtsE [Clostridiales bacterium]|jgi:cell division transport system ATP-binding protein|nr:cell division ATP-binding protein FtsE [Clostridiales bacterium]